MARGGAVARRCCAGGRAGRRQVLCARREHGGRVCTPGAVLDRGPDSTRLVESDRLCLRQTVFGWMVSGTVMSPSGGNSLSCGNFNSCLEDELAAGKRYEASKHCEEDMHAEAPLKETTTRLQLNNSPNNLAGYLYE